MRIIFESLDGIFLFYDQFYEILANFKLRRLKEWNTLLQFLPGCFILLITVMFTSRLTLSTLFASNPSRFAFLSIFERDDFVHFFVHDLIQQNVFIMLSMLFMTLFSFNVQWFLIWKL